MPLRKLGPSHYTELLDQQGGVCAICRQSPSKRRLAVDHCHQNDFVRGLLCIRCNLALPFLENEEWLRNALNYVQRARAFSAERSRRGLRMIEFSDFMRMEFPKEDWRVVEDPHRQDLLLQAEVEKMCYFQKMRPTKVARELGISRARVLRLLRGELRDGPPYYRSGEINWPQSGPSARHDEYGKKYSRNTPVGRS